MEPRYDLREAAARFFPGGQMIRDKLKQQIRWGRLDAEMVCGQYFVTESALLTMSRAISAMRCRRPTCENLSLLEISSMAENILRSAHIRCRVDPGDVPPEKAARRMGLRLAEFEQKLPELLARGFPPPDPTTGMFDLDAINQWRAARHCRGGSAPGLTAESKPRNAEEVFRERARRLLHG
jgi:hypothetical protein